MRDPPAGLSSRRPRRPPDLDPLSRTGERARVARDQLARAREHLEVAHKRLERAKGKSREPE
jgi:hypothetical protein